MGILDRIREPKVDEIAPSLRGVTPGLLLAFEAVTGVSRTSRRNSELFILNVGIKQMIASI